MTNNKQSHDWKNLKEACAATLIVMNERLANQFSDPVYRLDLVDAPMARSLGQVFHLEDPERLVSWEWENLFHKRVKRNKAAWMYAVSVGDQLGAVCYGTISIQDDYVSIDYIERKMDIAALKGMAMQIAMQYAEVLAVYLELVEVRVCDPDPALIDFYEQNFGLTRQSDGEEVAYLYRKVQP